MTMEQMLIAGVIGLIIGAILFLRRPETVIVVPNESGESGWGCAFILLVAIALLLLLLTGGHLSTAGL